MNVNLNFRISYQFVMVGMATAAIVGVIALTDNPIRRRILKHYERT